MIMSYSKKIENDLRNKIQNGFYPKGSLIPKQTELSSYYNISRVTIQKVLENLKIEGYLQSKTGVGTLVREDFSPLDCKVEEFGGTTKRYGKFGKITSQIISFEKRPVELFEQEKLRLKGTGIVYDLIRLRLLNDEPFSLEYTIMPTQTIPGIT